MYGFIQQYKTLLVKLSLSDQTVLLKLYVDELNQAGLCLPLGTRYVADKLYIPGVGWRGRSRPGNGLEQNEIKQIERECNELYNTGGNQVDRERHSASIYRQIANGVRPRSVRMKEDTPGNHSNGCLPILDTHMEVVGGQIVHHHF